MRRFSGTVRSQGVEALEDGAYRLFVAKRNVPGRMEPPAPQADVFTAPLSGAHVFLKAAFDFRDVPDTRDTVQFSYSEDGNTWLPAGERQNLSFNLRYFVGTRAALYCYGAGSADFRRFTARVL